MACARVRTACVLALASTAFPALTQGIGAQVPYDVFDDATEVATIAFRFPNGRSIPTSRIRNEIVLTARGGMTGLRDAFSFLPLVPEVGTHPFDILELQRDVARIRRLYAESGFLGTQVRYEVEFRDDENRVEIAFIIDEGRPILLRSIGVTTMDGGDPAELLPDDLVGEWSRFVERRSRQVGERLTQPERNRHLRDVLNWWLDRGWAFMQGRGATTIDSTAALADFLILIAPGPRTRIGPIIIEGNTSVSSELITDVLPFRTGDWFSARQIAEGQRRIYGLDLFRLALVDVAPDQSQDSTARVRIRVEEVPPRLITGELGFIQSGGLSMQGEFAHRNFMGGARTLRVAGLAQTGQLAFSQAPDKNYRLSLSLRRPFTFHPRMSLTVAPFVQYRDDVTDRSTEYGVETSLVYELGPFRYITFLHRFRSRRILDFRIGSGTTVDLITLLRAISEGALDSIGDRIDRNSFTLSGTIGRFDPTRSVRALQVRPSIEVTLPSALNTIEFTQVDVPITGFLPLGERVAIAARARVGRVFPFGKTIQGDSLAGPVQAIQLRDVLLTAGGTGSARGWGEDLLGPKVLNLRVVDPENLDSTELATRGWAPVGGLARASGSVELRLPFPGLGERWGTHLFLDAGRVWTPDARFRGDDPFGQQQWFYGAGGGIDLNTIVGPVRVSVGYKLNPSPFDVRDPRDVLEAVIQEMPLSSVPTDWKRRIHLHISLGQSF